MTRCNCRPHTAVASGRVCSSELGLAILVTLQELHYFSKEEKHIIVFDHGNVERSLFRFVSSKMANDPTLSLSRGIISYEFRLVWNKTL